MKCALFIMTSIMASTTFGEVYDGGAYRPGHAPSEVNSAKLGRDLAPQRFARATWFTAAPVGKPLYVIGEDQKCYWGDFAKSKGQSVLLVYYLSPVSNEHCIYQQNFSPKPSGYSVSVKEGGVCLPTEASVEGERYDWVVTQQGESVPFATCFGGLESYGDNIDKKHHQPVAAEKPKDIVPEKEVVKSPPEVFEIVSEELPAPTPKAGRIPSSVDKKAVAFDGTYTLQLSSHLTEMEANTAIETLKTRGIEAFQFQGVVEGKTRYRVCTGHFSKTKKAREFQSILVEKGVNQSFVQMLPK